MNYQSEFVQRCLTDTGFLARYVLGMDHTKMTDAHGQIVEVRPGGILPDGPHKRMVELLDSPSKQKLMEAPRGSFKTSLIIAWIVRMILVNPNIRIFYGSDVYSEATKTVNMVRDLFERCEMLRAVFGDYVGDDWRRERFTVSKRTRFLREPTMSAFATDKDVTGGHCDVLITDDVVTNKNSGTAEGLAKAISIFEAAQPLLDPGGIQLANGTRYNDSDLLGHIETNLGDLFEKLILDAGVDLLRDGKGGYELVGEPTFIHLDKKLLQLKLGTMGPHKFSAQYLNRCLPAGMAIFDRHNFKSMRWDDSMQDYSWYVLTDSAVSEREDGCYSAIALVGIDSVNNAYVADLRVGHWPPAEFRSTLFEVLDRWQQRLSVRSVLMETIAMNRVFKAMIEEEARKRQMRVNLVDVMRGGSSQSKDQRIQSLQGRFVDGRMYFLDTIPKTFNDLGTTKVLFDPTGLRVEGGTPLPDGELVLEFVRFPAYGKKDIADALADIEAVDRSGMRLCNAPSFKHTKRNRERELRAGRVVPIPMMVNGQVRLVDINTSSGTGTDGDNFWPKLAARIKA